MLVSADILKLFVLYRSFMGKEIVFGVLVLALILFAWGKIRHDFVALICLLILVFSGVVPAEDSFLGFAHPAVITVAMILVVGHGLKKSGLVEWLGNYMVNLSTNFTIQLALLCGLVCFASAFMNNVGALAVSMPLAVHIANKNGTSVSYFLMPIAFSSLLGGMITLIGTPPNIIISTFRSQALGVRYRMFDFAPVGIGLAIVGILFIVLLGWRFIPKRIAKDNDDPKFNINDYITEVKIGPESNLKNAPHSTIYDSVKGNIQILDIIRNKQLIYAPGRNFVFKENDIIAVQGDSNDLKEFIETTRTVLVGKEKGEHLAIGMENITLSEAVVMANSPMIERSASEIHMSFRYGVNLLAISRRNKQVVKRIDHVKFQIGDILLVQGESEKMTEALDRMGCLPLADRGISLGEPKKIALAVGVFVLALVMIITRLAEVQIAFTVAALLMVLFKIVPIRDFYTSIDWPIIVLLGALLPLGTALETSGGAELIASQILVFQDSMAPWMILGVVLVFTMFLSDIINNAATVVLMAPIALSVATGLEVSPDPFLMAVAIGASCAFLTPIGHQSNALVMGPGGYKFTDYARMGIPLEVIIVLVGIPLIHYFWPM